MMGAAPAAVRGDFNNAAFAVGEHRARFFRRGAEFWVEFAHGANRPQAYQVVYTFGVEPLQQYLVEQPGGRLQFIPFAWDSRPAGAGGSRWFMLYPDAGPDDEFYWTNPGQNWNYMCADCHSTNVRKNYSTATNSYDTRWSELNVACEACHGPAGRHLAVLDEDSTAELPEFAGFASSLRPAVASWTRPNNRPTAVPGERFKGQQLEVCAQCHSRREQLTDAVDVAPGDFMNRHRLTLLQNGRYYPDGQIYDETYVYGSFLQSRMHAAGVVCSNCHEPHSVRLRLPQDQLCSQCHAPEVFATPAHHMHQPESEGAACTACHMPETVFMQLDSRADHSFRVPRPDISDQLGTPNACTGCHAERSALWAARAVRDHFPESPRRAAPGFAGVFAAADSGRPGLQRELSFVAQNPEFSEIARASALSRMSGYPGPDTLLALARATRGTALQKLGAAQGTDGLPTERAWEVLRPLLDDAALAVRITAAAALAERWPELSSAQRNALQPALTEYIETQEFNSDRAYARSNIAGVRAAQGDIPGAIAAYRGALDIEPGFAPGWVNLADLLRSGGDEAAAIELLRTAVTRLPDSAEINFALGLAEVRAGRTSAAVQQLGAAAQLAPENAYYRYVFGLAQESRNLPAALTNLREAYRLSGDPQYLYAECDLAIRNGDPSARDCVEQLDGQAPAAVVQGLRERLQGQR
jgi:tetratricopeptide (TPR) repeat protein